jgi:protein arginine kinase activator
MTFAEFKRLGRVGCAECYSAFASQLEPLVRRIHGSCQHVGRGTQPGPKPAQEKVRLEQLRDALAAAVEQEDYEKAASLRDALARCEDESGGG